MDEFSKEIRFVISEMTYRTSFKHKINAKDNINTRK
jgi:hypothetical protein